MDWPGGRHWLCLLTVAMSEEAERLKERTMRFALDVCHLIKHLPQSEPGPTIRRQLAKAATSVAFNYRASCRARSHIEFTAKVGVVAEEADESQGWFDSAIQLPDCPITRFTASLCVVRIPARAHLRCADRTPARFGHTRRGIRCGSDSRPSDLSIDRRQTDRRARRRRECCTLRDRGRTSRRRR